MSVEILTVSLSDESIAKVADAVAARLGGQAVTQSNPPSAQYPQGAEAPASQPQADPWMNATPAPPAQQYQQQAPPQQYAQQGPPPQPQAQVPTCAHGPMRYVPAGTSQSTGRSYPAFYGCPLPRGAQGKCQSVQA